MALSAAGRYRKGYRNEKRSRAFLEAQGYAVIEARGSHGIWDMVGVRGDSTVLCQVKTNRNASPAERQAMEAFPRPVGGWKCLHIWYDGDREPVVKEVV